MWLHGGYGEYLDEIFTLRLMDTPPCPLVDDQMLSPRNLAKGPSETSGVATFEPYVPSIDHKKRKNIKGGKLVSKNKVHCETLPGLFETANYIQYLTLEYEDDQRIQNSDFFEIHRQIVSTLGREPKIVFQGNGSVLVEVTSLEEKENLLSLTTLNGKSAKCAPHKLMNQSKGVIRAPLLTQFSEERLQKEFESQGVIEVKQMKKKIDGILTPLPTYVLTFDLPRLPKEIKAAWLYFDVRPYIPAPKRCFYCHRFGHVNDNCRRRLKGDKKICYNCGQDEHGECERTSFCVNCRENHPSVSKTCDRYVLEREILAVRSKEHITYIEAKKRVLSQSIRPGITFASIMKKSMSTNKQDTLVDNKKPPSSPKKTSVLSAKRRLSREEQDISPLSKSNRYEILNDEMECVYEPTQVGADVDSLGQALAPTLSHSVVQADIHVLACSPERDDAILTSSQAVKQGEASTSVSAQVPAETKNLIGSQERPTEIKRSTPPQKKCGDESFSKVSSNKSSTAPSYRPNRRIKVLTSNRSLSKDTMENKEVSSGKTLTKSSRPKP